MMTSSANFSVGEQFLFGYAQWASLSVQDPFCFLAKIVVPVPVCLFCLCSVVFLLPRKDEWHLGSGTLQDEHVFTEK